MLSDFENIFDVRKLAPGVHVITEVDFVHAYLVEGRDWAVLIDSGLGYGDIRAVVEGLTPNPVIVVNTHAHPDHAGGNSLFENIAVHPAEAGRLGQGSSADLIRAYFEAYPGEAEHYPPVMSSGQFEVRPSQATHLLSHGEAIDLGGGRVLEVLHTPGHSRGSICLLDEANRLLFTGDTVYAGTLWAQLDESDLGQYAETARSLSAIGWEVNLVFPGHGETPQDGGLLLEMGAAFERLLDGEGLYEHACWQGQTAYDVNLGRVSVRVREDFHYPCAGGAGKDTKDT